MREGVDNDKVFNQLSIRATVVVCPLTAWKASCLSVVAISPTVSLYGKVLAYLVRQQCGRN